MQMSESKLAGHGLEVWPTIDTPEGWFSQWPTNITVLVQEKGQLNERRLYT